MRIPYSILIFLPKGWQEKYIQHRWGIKKDSQIINAFEDACGWIDLSFGIFEDGVTKDIAEDCIDRLEFYILPQMRKRGLLTP